MHRRLFSLSLLLLAACAPQVTPSPMVASVTPAATLTDVASPTAMLTATLPPSATNTLAVSMPPTLPATLPPTLTPTRPVEMATTAAPTVDTALTPQPGLIIRGYVRMADGTAVPDVSICRNYASYGGSIVARTDANGYFESAFAFIPGDEMVGVWPVAQGYTFQPDNYRWRHYYGSEDRSLEFVATASTATAAAPFPCQ